MPHRSFSSTRQPARPRSLASDLVARISEAFRGGGDRSRGTWIKPRESDSAALDMAQAAKRPVVIAGGDGSVSAAVQRFAGTDTPLGVLPFGTYNLLAHDLGMSTDLDEAVRQIAAAQERRIDLGKVGRRPFHTLAGLGYFSRVARQQAEVRKSLPGSKIVGAAVAAFRSFTRGGALDVEVYDGERRKSFRTPAILITNNLLGQDTWRRSTLDAGMFEINVVRGDIPFPMLRGGFAAMTGSSGGERRYRDVDRQAPRVETPASARLPLAGWRDSQASNAAGLRDHAQGAHRAVCSNARQRHGSCDGDTRCLN